jgi:hypothetical protein
VREDGEARLTDAVSFGLAWMGLVYGPSAGRQRATHVLISRRCSRHMCCVVGLLLDADRGDCRLCGGVAVWVVCFGCWCPTTCPLVVADADAVNLRLTGGRGLDCAQHCGFATTRRGFVIRRTSPRVERVVGVGARGFSPASSWWTWPTAKRGCSGGVARSPGCGCTARSRPDLIGVFAEHEAGALPAVPEPYDDPWPG